MLEPLSVGQNTPFRDHGNEQSLRNTATLFAGARGGAHLRLMGLEVVQEVVCVLAVLFVQELKESVRVARNRERVECGYSRHGLKVRNPEGKRKDGNNERPELASLCLV